jgi:acetyl esterase
MLSEYYPNNILRGKTLTDHRIEQAIRPDVAGFLAMLAQMSSIPMHEGTVEEARAAYTALTPLADAEPESLAVIRDLSCPGPAGDIPLRLYDVRETRGPGPVMIFFHGGGFVIGNLESHHSICSYFAKHLDIPVIAVDYRLAPEYPFPAALNDSEAAARWIAENGDALGFEITGLVLCGDSAGGNITISTTQALIAKPAARPVIAQFPLYPVTDNAAKEGSMQQFADGHLLTAAGMDWFLKHYSPAAGDPRADVILGGHKNCPPTLVFTAGLDPLRDQGRDYAKALEAASVKVIHDEAEGNIHGFICLRKAVPTSVKDVDRIIGHMRSLMR